MLRADLADSLRSHGHDVVRASEIGQARADVHETWALVQARMGWKAVDDFLDVFLPLCQVKFVDTVLHAAGVARCRQAHLRELSLTDETRSSATAKAQRTTATGTVAPLSEGLSAARSFLLPPVPSGTVDNTMTRL